MRYAEIEKGIEVFADEKLTESVGTSKACAESAVKQTALSRMLMSAIVLGLPTALIVGSNKLGIVPKAKVPKFLFDVQMCIMGLLFGLPLSVAYFPPVASLPSKQLEPEFKDYERIYFSKGL